MNLLVPDGFPNGSKLQKISFRPDHGLQILVVPITEESVSQLLAQACDWVAAVGVGNDANKPQTLSLYGAQIIWNSLRATIIAQPEKTGPILLALTDFFLYDAALSEIETEIDDAWPHIKTDAAFAFEFSERAVPKRHELSIRFENTVSMRARLARLAPHVHRLSTHPATITSQLNERLRERTRMVSRFEFLSSQLDVLEDVYGMCGQRVSDFMLARQQIVLEWAIVFLLAAELLLLVTDLMASVGN